jgi:hypothetical protein
LRECFFVVFEGNAAKMGDSSKRADVRVLRHTELGVCRRRTVRLQDSRGPRTRHCPPS